MKHINVTVTGRVQGVYFRAATQETAEFLGITGFVKNQTDGSVYLEAEGKEKTLKEFCQWLNSGPPAARVDKLDILVGEVQHLKDFIISR